MSLFCPKCGSALKEGAVFCPKCGYRLKERNANKNPSVNNETEDKVTESSKYDSVQLERPKEPVENTIAAKPVKPVYAETEKKRISTGVIIAILAVLLLLGGGGSFYYFKVAKPKMTYNNAIKLAGEGKYNEAIAVLEELGDYQDSLALIKQYREKTYLSDAEVENIADQAFLNFVKDYSNNYGEDVHAYLPKSISSKSSNHAYDYYYVFFASSDYDVADTRVIKVTIKTSENGQYTVEKQSQYKYIVRLKSVHGSNMNVRDYPDSSIGSRVGKIGDGEYFQVYGMYFGSLYNDVYVWYCISADGYSEWVADGVKASGEYYVFENGISTKEIVFNY